MIKVHEIKYVQLVCDCWATFGSQCNEFTESEALREARKDGWTDSGCPDCSAQLPRRRRKGRSGIA